jgi:hypothetical protein
MCEFNCYLYKEMVGQWQDSGRINVVGSNKMYLDLQLKFPALLPDFNQMCICSTDVAYVLSLKYHGNPSSGSCADTCGETDKLKHLRTDTHEFIGVQKW